MYKTGTLVLLLAMMATGLMAQPAPPANTSFDVIVNGTVLAPGGQLPDAEIGVEYWGARVVLDNAVAQQGDWVIQNYTHRTGLATPSHPHQIYANGDYSQWGGPNSRYVLGSPQSVITPGTYTIAFSAIFYNTAWAGSPFSQHVGTEQYYTIEIRPYGYGVVYPAPVVPPGGGGGGGGTGSGSSGGGGDDGGCSTVAGAGLGVPTTISAMIGALFWRRRKDKISPRGKPALVLDENPA